MVLKDKPYKKGMVLSMKSVTKRDNRIVEFDREKIVSAIQRAFIEVDGTLSDSAKAIAESTADKVALIPEDMSVEQIQDQVIYSLMGTDRKDVAKAYTEYRFKHNLARDFRNTTDQAIMDLLDHKNEEINGENSNKDPEIVSVQRDYIAGITSKDITRRILLDEDIVKADAAGIIHFHDADYYAQNVLTNCSLCNLEDMLQNGTVINGTKIDKPHRFITASTIATQIITAVTSSQYGGISITLTHLAPFVRDSYNRYLAKYRSWGFDEKQAAKYADIDTRKEVEDGCQTFIYQVNSMSTTNGQAPFLTVFMYINETEEYKDELIMLIEEFLRQRIQGMKNEQGVWVTPAFPKLIYVLDEDNIKPGTKYWDTTVLAAQCTAKRMVPDYISAKVMKQLKGGVYPPMSCVTGDEVVTYRFAGNLYVEGMERMWWRLLPFFKAKEQRPGSDDWYMNLTGVEIYDHINGWTNCHRIIRNTKCAILRIKFSNGRCLDCTPSHPFETVNRGVVLAKDLKETDEIAIDYDSHVSDKTDDYDPELAWLDGLIICDASYVGSLAVSLANEGEEDIIEALQDRLKRFYGITTKVKVQVRGRKGTYKDIIAVSTDSGIPLPKFSNIMITKFGGIIKLNRQIPSVIFESSREARLGFLAGMIDADGYISDCDNSNTRSVCSIGSTNKELAIQQMMLIQSLGIPAVMYQNHYKGKGRYDQIRYQVVFVPTEESIKYVVAQKKRNHFVNPDKYVMKNKDKATCHFVESHMLDWVEDTYDVSTASEHFTVSGLYSHNCTAPDEVITYKYNDESHVTSMESAWNFFKDKFDVISQETGIAGDTYMDLSGVQIYDHVNGWTECKRMIHNHADKMLRVTFTNGRTVEVTPNHPFTVETNSSTESIVYAEKLNAGDTIRIDSEFKAFNEDDLKEYNSPNDEKPAQAAENFVLNKVRDDELLTLDTIFNYKEATRREFLYGLIQTMRDDLTFVKDPKVDPDPRDENRSFVDDYNDHKVIGIHYLEKSRALKIMMLAQSVGVYADIHVEDAETRHYQDLYKVQLAPTYELVKICEDDQDTFWGNFSDSVMNDLENANLFHQEYAVVESVTRRYAVRENYDVTTESEHFSFSGIYSHNCRSFVTPYTDPTTGKPKYYGRFNCGVVTISLPDLAFSSGGDYDKFWQLFEERTELCHRALRARIDRIKDTSVNVAPILWRHGAFARMPQDAKIGDIMFGGYATISLGYAGLYECVKYMTGHSHMDKGIGTEFGLKVMQALNDKCTQWKTAEHIDYSLYGTPIENTTYKFARCLKKRFGNDIFVKLDGKDRDYITNSYHTAVFEKINPFDKLIQEAEFQKLSPGGAISYIECSDLTHNIPAVLQVMQCIYDNILYAELNIKSDYCSCCGYDGEIKVIDDGGKLVWECPNCGNRDQHKMSVARRTCGLNYSI